MGGRALTYDQLNRAANRIARAVLKKRGLGSEPIMSLFEHGVEAIIACIGILKTGNILVAVDPSLPSQHIAFMLDDSQARLILTDDKNYLVATRLANGGRHVIAIDSVEENLCTDNLGLRISPDAIAQIRYSSGSAGRPKGIACNHRRFLNSRRQINEVDLIYPDDRMLILRHPSAATRDVFKGLLVGGVVLPFDIKREGFSRLAEFIKEERISYYSSTTSTFRYLIQELRDSETLSSVRIVYLDGEALSKREVESYKKHFSEKCLLVNMYGSNEVGGLCHFIINKDTIIDTPIVPAGYPLPDKEIFIVDDNGNEVGFKQVGEIAVRSRNLFSKYWENTELTAAKFIPDSKGGDHYIYLTGDLGCMLPDSCVIYLGRKDLEIKIRGYKVSPTEVEVAMLLHPQIQEVGVAAWDREGGEKYLAAYVVPRENTRPTVDELRQFLHAQLPDYMIPSRFVFLKELPLTNGKQIGRAHV